MKLWFYIVLILLPSLVWGAEGALNFTPPPEDYSIIYLGNIFGLVDGVLHGYGTQILGRMFAVFNGAVLALGGIIIVYTLLVSTLHTAHEGKFLGEKWSSLWVPVRTTVGLALLIPKASGYCLMQIFVMWVVVQGVGAADKIWGAALDYLNQGGVIIQKKIDPTQIQPLAKMGSVSRAGLNILSGQVCMLGLQKTLENARESYLSLKDDKTGPCYGTLTSTMSDFCTQAVPDFIGSVNLVSAQNTSSLSTSGIYSVDMPNFQSGSIYSNLNGICGKIGWKPFKSNSIWTTAPNGNVTSRVNTITLDDINTLKMTRTIALQQLFLDLSMIANAMVNNSPAFSDQTDDTNNYSEVAREQFGTYNSSTKAWVSTNVASAAMLFNGTEYQNALSDYYAIILPAWNLDKQAGQQNIANSARAFMTDARQQGWIMAGSYFFDIVKLNQIALTNTEMTLSTNVALTGETAEGTGLDNTVGPTSLTDSFSTDTCSGTLCTFLNNSTVKLKNIMALIEGGNGTDVPTVYKPELRTFAGPSSVSGTGSSTVYGYVSNAVLKGLTAQPGYDQPQFASTVPDISNLSLNFPGMPTADIECLDDWGSFLSGGWIGCVIREGMQKIYNFLRWFFNSVFVVIISTAINKVLIYLIVLPLEGIASIFQQSVKIVATPGVNPVVALAMMGTWYVNSAIDLWSSAMSGLAYASILGSFGTVMIGIVAIVLPIFLAWFGLMLGIGFVTAYYIPLLPFMIFTFGAIGWLIAVIEAMVAAPIVALGVTHPEGHEAFGKGEQALMILMNVFLRPAMMIIGFITAIILTYVGVWILNAGFDHALIFMQGGDTYSSLYNSVMNSISDSSSIGYKDFALVFTYFFSVLIYTSTYLVIVQRSFTLISMLPDKVLRWIGGQAEGIGQETSQWGEEVKRKVEEGGQSTSSGAGTSAKLAGAQATGAIDKAKGLGSSVAKKFQSPKVGARRGKPKQ